MWDQVYSSTSSKDKSKSKGKKQDGQGQKERTLEQELTEKYHFKNIQNKSLDENSDMWEKYNFIRRIRKQAVHPHTRQISVTDAGNVVDYTYQIGDWISFQS